MIATSGPWGRLVAPSKGIGYQFTDEDVLWGCRAVVGEGAGDALEVLHCMAQRWAFVDGARERSWPLFHNLLTAYSQPINSIWRRDGARCKGNIGGKHCEEHRLKKRDFLASASLEELLAFEGGRHARGVEMALAWFRGEKTTDKIPGCVHFDDGGSAGASDRRVVFKGANTFYSVSKSASLPVDFVRVEPAAGLQRPSQARAIAVALGVAVGLALMALIDHAIKSRRP